MLVRIRFLSVLVALTECFVKILILKLKKQKRSSLILPYNFRIVSNMKLLNQLLITLFSLFINVVCLSSEVGSESESICSVIHCPDGCISNIYTIEELINKLQLNAYEFNHEDLSHLISDLQEKDILADQINNMSVPVMAFNFLNAWFDGQMNYKFDSSLGFIKDKNEKIVFLNINVPNAISFASKTLRDYNPERDKNLDDIKTFFNHEFINQIHSLANQYHYIDGKFIEKKQKFSSRKKIIFLKYDIHNSVLLKSRKYGFIFHTDVKGNITLHKYVKRSEPPDYESELKKLSDDLVERLTHNKVSYLDAITEFYQDFMLLHPYSGGNGRTGRVLMQVLIKKLFGFEFRLPYHFHEELRHEAKILSDELFIEMMRSSLDNKLLIKKMKDTKKSQIETKYLEETADSNKYTDKKFQSFKLNSDGPIVSNDPNLLGNLNYADLPDEVTKHDKLVFYGVPVKERESYLNKIELMFKYGRNSRGKKIIYQTYKHI